jgi:spermidine synthase
LRSPIQRARVIFFLSGGAALLYQVIWQRLLVFFSGADIYSITIIVAAFMSGLGVGSLAGGRLADRLGPRGSLWAFAAAELGIAGFGLISKWLYYDVLYERLPHLAAASTTAAVVLFASLLLPTFLMGVSLPLLSRALTAHISATGQVVGSLYGWNTLGAAAGALAGTWILLPWVFLEGSLRIAAGLNLICALGAASLVLTPRHADPSPGAATVPPPDAAPPSLPFGAWVLIYGLTGFIALSLEIAWFRMLGVLLKSNAFTFGTLLAVYLAGLGLGAAVAAGRVSRSRRPGAIFLALQYGLTLYAAAGILGLMALLAAGVPAGLAAYVASYEPIHLPGTFLSAGSFARLIGLYVVLPAALVGPATFLMGASFPFLQRAVQSDLPHLGRRLGTLLAANIAGAVIGTLLTGFLLLPRLGTAGTLQALVGMGVVLTLPLVLVVWPGRRSIQAAAWLATVAITGTAVTLMPRAEVFWSRLHGTTPDRLLFGEDGAGLSVLKMESDGFRGPVEVFVNGLGQSVLPYGGIHTLLGLLPALIHPDPQDVVVIGLGSGDTVFGAAARRDVQRLVAVEVIGAQRETLERMAGLRPYPGLVAVLRDPRIEHLVDDGRAFLLQSARRFDIIEADALRPTSAYSGNLYSREYFELLRARLKTGGLAVTWAPTVRVLHTFLTVFPHAMVFGPVLVGSSEPIPFDRMAIANRAAAVADRLAPAGLDVQALVGPNLAGTPVTFGPDTPRGYAALNGDLVPRDEFARPY